MSNLVKSVALHNHPEYMEECIDVLCEEWGRSRTARKVMLEKSCPTMPYNVVLLKLAEGSKFKVIGHSRLCHVVGENNFAYVESVVVSKCMRGQGMGRQLMDETEKHALSLGITTLCLNTTDKQDFYEHLGYSYSKPITSIGCTSGLMGNKFIEKLFRKNEKSDEIEKTSAKEYIPSNTNTFNLKNNALNETEKQSSDLTNQSNYHSISFTDKVSEQSNCQLNSHSDALTVKNQSNILCPPQPPPPPLFTNNFSKLQSNEVIMVAAHHMQKCLL